jgi:hypothetical protein
MKKLNCWEVLDCGREPGGRNTEEMGVCPTAVETSLDGVHGGVNAGRACWIVGGLTCTSGNPGEFSSRTHDCAVCRFRATVNEDHNWQLKDDDVLVKIVWSALPV